MRSDGELVRAIRTYDGSAVTRIALQLMALTFVRTKELRHGRWSEIDLDAKTWTVPWLRMKGKKHGPPGPDHIVPLSEQAVALLIELKAITGHGELLFPNEGNPSKAMSENTMLYALYRLGYHKRATVHGFRASASTLLNEMGFDEDAVERQLAHVENNKVRRAYHRAEYLDERRVMMQKWADLLDQQA